MRWGYGIKSPFGKGMAPTQASGTLNATTQHTMLFNSLMHIIRTAGLEPAMATKYRGNHNFIECQ